MPFGSGVRELLVELDPAALVQARFSVEDVVTALDEASADPHQFPWIASDQALGRRKKL